MLIHANDLMFILGIHDTIHYHVVARDLIVFHYYG